MQTIGLYFHIPFCNSKCNYCDFDSAVDNYLAKKIYIDALVKEIDISTKKYNLNNYIVDTVFIGGGTPTSLDEPLLQRLLNKIDDSFNFAKNLEYSIEVNPNSISLEKIKIMKNSKINRVSIGLQSVNSHELTLLGRTHTYEEFKTTYTNLKNSGFDNINVDLMMGIPHQTLDTYKHTLDEIISLSPEHISAYMLIVEDGTPFARSYDEGIFVIDEDMTLQMYEYTVDFLQKNSYQQYEISNFAKTSHTNANDSLVRNSVIDTSNMKSPTDHIKSHSLQKDYRCKHNIKYWKVDQYLGFGQNAHSYLDKKRFSNSSQDYVNKLQKGILPIENIQYQSEKDLYEEHIFLQLRMNEGIKIDEFSQKFGINFRQKYSSVLKQLYDSKFINNYETTLSLTNKGIQISNQIFLKFMD